MMILKTKNILTQDSNQGTAKIARQLKALIFIGAGSNPADYTVCL
jgi:hypothetical protein